MPTLASAYWKSSSVNPPISYLICLVSLSDELSIKSLHFESGAIISTENDLAVQAEEPELGLHDVSCVSHIIL